MPAKNTGILADVGGNAKIIDEGDPDASGESKTVAKKRRNPNSYSGAPLTAAFYVVIILQVLHFMVYLFVSVTGNPRIEEITDEQGQIVQVQTFMFEQTSDGKNPILSVDRFPARDTRNTDATQIFQRILVVFMLIAGIMAALRKMHLIWIGVWGILCLLSCSVDVLTWYESLGSIKANKNTERVLKYQRENYRNVRILGAVMKACGMVLSAWIQRDHSNKIVQEFLREHAADLQEYDSTANSGKQGETRNNRSTMVKNEGKQD